MKLAIVGLGKMGSSILEGVLDAGLLSPEEVGVLDASPELTERKAARYGVRPLDLSALAEAERV
ncbi:MAG TPA: pyrroline-5-carboxylate reductase, partial [Oceanithermus sp.]|nr:pyrroline-5-carboxylate reductase [Oceanithermus sp.]